MIKQNELRLGIYFRFIGSKKNYDIVLQMDSNLLPDYISEESDLALIQAIPLTEEWLLKLGFRYLSVIDTWQKGEFFIKESKSNHYIGQFRLLVSEYSTGQYFKYVHQLQNLYFALTGEELQAK